MKSGEAGFRRSRVRQPVHPVIPHAHEAAPTAHKKVGLSARAQRRFEESEARRVQRRERKRRRRPAASAPYPVDSPDEAGSKPRMI